MRRASRRRFLGTTLAGSSLVLAGCLGPSSGTGDATDGADGTATAPMTDAAPMTDTNTGTDDDLDLREANVVGVAVQRQNGEYRFDVTLYHDDDGEDGYANWWQVERLDGERLGRRELLHAHGTREFTRSDTISVPEGVTCVVVRGHDQTHGYGGQAMVVNLETGGTTAVEQGTDPQSFDDFEC